MTNIDFINQPFTLSLLLQQKDSPTFFGSIIWANKGTQSDQIGTETDTQDLSSSIYLPLQLKMPIHLQDKRKKLIDIVMNMLNNYRLIDEYTPEQLQEIQNFITEELKPCTTPKQKNAFEQLLEQIQVCLDSFSPEFAPKPMRRR
ncbi:MAG: hypothetical protein K2Q14_01905 [Gammaproteobacteria bacterium]|nr:hypothetical protein [Gammaproteobacteria bacterium]